MAEAEHLLTRTVIRGGGTDNLRATEADGKPEDTMAKHVHIGNEAAGGACYQTPVYHQHTGNSVDGGGCYTVPQYHTHQSDGTISYVDETSDKVYRSSDGVNVYGWISDVKGKCYNTPVYIYHNHTTDCYHLHHTNDCKQKVYCSEKYSYIRDEGTPGQYIHTDYHGKCPKCGRDVCTPWNPGWGTCNNCYDCDQLGELVCGKETTTIEETMYALDCPKTEEMADSYSLGCGLTERSLLRYALTCTKKYDDGCFLGASGLYGGGGGYYGGKNGYLILHQHTDRNGVNNGSTSSVGGGNCFSSTEHADYQQTGTKTVTTQEACYWSTQTLGDWSPDTAGWTWVTICCCGQVSSRGPCSGVAHYKTHSHTEPVYGWVRKGYYDRTCSKIAGVTVDAKDSGAGGSNYCTSKNGYLIKNQAGVRSGNGFCKITTVSSISYNLNKGTFGKNHPNFIWYGEDGTIDNPTRAGYTFQGWDIEGMELTPYIGGKAYNNISATRIKDTLFKNLRKTPGWVTFTAIWKDETPPDIDDIVYKNTATTKYGGEVYNGIEYTPGTWTGQTVTATVSTHDAGSGINSLRWTGKAYPNVDKASVAEDTDDWILNNTEDVNNFTNTKTFTETGVYKGIIYVRDNADTENEDHISNGVKNESKIEYGEIWIDKDKPTGLIEYGYCTDKDFSVDKWTYASDGSYLNESQIGQWNVSGALPTNKNVVVRITAQDAHSGVHDISAYSWDSESDWTNKNTKIFDECTEGYVLVRDNVGNVERFDYKISNIDKKDPFVYPDKKPKDDDVSGEPLPKDEDETDYKYGDDTDYTFQHLDNLLTYDWVNYDLNLVFHSKEEPQKAPDKEYSTSGIARMELFRTDSSFTYEAEDSVAKTLKSETLSYTVKTQGITYYVLEIEDEATNMSSIHLTVKVDKTAPVIPNGLSGGEDSYRFYIEDIDLNKYGIQVQGNGKTEIENKIQDMSAMKRSFLFVGSDKNKEAHGDMTDETDSSGICQFIIKLINADDESDFKEYKLTDGDNYTFGNYGNETRVGFLTGPVSEFNYEPAVNTMEFASLGSNIKVPLAATFGIELNTFKDFPNAAALKYQITIVDRAGNKTVYNSDSGNEIRNFSIKAVIHYAGVLDEDSNSISESANLELNVQQDDPSNGKLTNIPYFKSGEFGYVEVWTIGYVPEIGFDFADEGVGQESKKEIEDGHMHSIYNLGIRTDSDDVTEFIRTISYKQGEKIPTSLDDYNGVPFATYYGRAEALAVTNSSFKDFAGRFKENGTAIRIPVYYALEPDGTKKSDGSDNYKWKVCEANILAYVQKGEKKYTETSNPLYVIWDTKIPDAHYRVTHES